jgi:hypothetical protein
MGLKGNADIPNVPCFFRSYKKLKEREFSTLNTIFSDRS